MSNYPLNESFGLLQIHIQDFASALLENFNCIVGVGVANGTSKNVGLGKFWRDLEISEAFLISLEVSFLHGLYLLLLSLETFYQRVSGSDF